MSETNCVIGSKPHTADVGYLCRHHFTKLGETLRDVEDEAIMLSAVPSMQQRTGNRGGSPASERSPVRIDVLVFRDPQTRRWVRDAENRYAPPPPKSFGPWCLFCEHQTCTAWRAGRQRDLHDDEHDAGSDRLMSILGVLHGWARIVREDRDLTAPDRITVTGERSLLTRHLEWLSGRGFIDEMYGELRELRASLKALNGTQDERPYGQCYLPTDVGTCDGPIWLDMASGHAHCGQCRQTWDGQQLAMLKWELDRAREEAARPMTADGRRMLTADELARQQKTTVNAIRLRLSRLRVKATHGSYYDPAVLGAPRHTAEAS